MGRHKSAREANKDAFDDAESRLQPFASDALGAPDGDGIVDLVAGRRLRTLDALAFVTRTVLLDGRQTYRQTMLRFHGRGIDKDRPRVTRTHKTKQVTLVRLDEKLIAKHAMNDVG